MFFFHKSTHYISCNVALRWLGYIHFSYVEFLLFIYLHATLVKGPCYQFTLRRFKILYLPGLENITSLLLLLFLKMKINKVRSRNMSGFFGKILNKRVDLWERIVE